MLWFNRLSEVPNVNYVPHLLVDRSKLAGYKEVPKFIKSIVDGKEEITIWWLNGETTEAPSRRWQTTPHNGELETQTALRELAEALELPGSLQNYSAIIQNCIYKLWANLHQETWFFTEIERLCCLDIDLIEKAYGNVTYLFSSFDRLVNIYKREGYLHEALEVALRAEKIIKKEYQEGLPLEELRKRIANIEAEDEYSSI